MNSEGPKKQEVKMPLTEEDIVARDKANDKTKLLLGGALFGSALTALSPVGEGISNSFNKDILTSESFSYKLDEPTDENPQKTEIIDVTLDGERVASFERPKSTPHEEN